LNSFYRFRHFTELLVGATILSFLAACAQPQTAAPSYALKQQLQELKQQQQEQQKLLGSLQEQLKSLQESLTAQKTSQPVSSFTPTTANQPVSTANNGIRQQEVAAVAASAADYLAAFSELASGHYSVAEDGFNKFLQKYPTHQYAPNARYWLATAQAEQGKRAEAITNLNQIVSASNGEEKAPAALAMMIRLYQQAGLSNQAESALAQLRSRFPQAPETQQFIQNGASLH